MLPKYRKKSFIFADNLVEDICLLNETNPFSQGIESGKEKAQNPTESINSEGDIENLDFGIGNVQYIYTQEDSMKRKPSENISFSLKQVKRLESREI